MLESYLDLASVCVLICEGPGSVCSIWYAYVRAAVSGTAASCDIATFSPGEKSKQNRDTWQTFRENHHMYGEEVSFSRGFVQKSSKWSVDFCMAKMQYLVRAVRKIQGARDRVLGHRPKLRVTIAIDHDACLLHTEARHQNAILLSFATSHQPSPCRNLLWSWFSAFKISRRSRCLTLTSSWSS